MTRVDGQLINVAGLWSEGVDVGLRYNLPLGIVAADDLGLSVNYTYLIATKSQGDPADDAINFAGTLTSPRYSMDARLTYRVSNFTLSWQAKYQSGGEYAKDYFGANPDLIALNKIESFMIHDIQGCWKVGLKKNFELFLGIDNLFDRKSQYIPSVPFGTPAGLETAAEFDLYGRRYYAGAVVHF